MDTDSMHLLLLDICAFYSQSQEFSPLKTIALLLPSCHSKLYIKKALITILDKISLLALEPLTLLCVFSLLLFITCHLSVCLIRMQALWRLALSMFCSLLCSQHLEQWLVCSKGPVSSFWRSKCINVAYYVVRTVCSKISFGQYHHVLTMCQALCWDVGI